MPQPDIFKGNSDKGTQQPGKGRNPFALDRVSFDRHGAASHLAFSEWLCHLSYLCSLQVPYLYCDLVKRRAHQRYQENHLGIAFPGYNLSRSIDRVKPKRLGCDFLHLEDRKSVV